MGTTAGVGDPPTRRTPYETELTAEEPPLPGIDKNKPMGGEFDSVKTIKKVRILSLRPGDILVLKTPYSLSMEAAKRLSDDCRREFPGHKAIVLEQGMELEVMELKLQRNESRSLWVRSS